MVFNLVRWLDYGKLDSCEPVAFPLEVTPFEYTLLSYHERTGRALSDIPELASLYERALAEATELFVEDIRSHLDPEDEDNSDWYEYHVGFE